MQPIEHSVKAIRQRTSECMQTAATQTMSFFDPTIQLADVLREVPLYIDDTGEKIGTSPGHLAAYMAKNSFDTTVYLFDTELFDSSWHGLEAEDIVANLRLRQGHIPANAWLAQYHHILVDGWQLFAAAKGTFAFPNLSSALLRHLLDDGPYIAMVNSTYLNRNAKQHYDKFVDDDIGGRSVTHAVTCAGYKDGAFLIVDPDPPTGENQHRWIEQDHLLTSIMCAQTESDNLLITIQRL